MEYKYRSFGILRFCLALLVVFQHFAANIAPVAFTQAVQGYEVGSVAVLVFFCLSGFVIAEAVDRIYHKRPKAFFENRMLRILPYFCIAMILSIGLHGLFFAKGIYHGERFGGMPDAESFLPENILLNLLGFIPGTERLQSYAFIPIVWAIRIEMAFYGVIILCIWAGKRFNLPWERVACYLLLPLLIVFFLSVYGFAPRIFSYVPYFAYGAALYFIVQRRKEAWPVAIGLTGPMLLQFFTRPDYHEQLGFLREKPAQGLLLMVLLALMGWLAARNFKAITNMDAYIGRFTYPLYMYHFSVLISVASIFSAGSMPVFIGGMMASILLAVLMTLALDPFIDRMRDRVRGQSIHPAQNG